MMYAALHARPRWRDVLLAQMRGIGLSLRSPAAVSMALVGLATLLVTIRVLGAGEAIDFHPERHMLPGVLGLLLAIAIWHQEDRFGDAFLWMLPVDRRWHALTRVFAGWVWLMGSVAFVAGWLLALAVASGGRIVPQETLHIIPSSWTGVSALDPALLQAAIRTSSPLLWLAPFTAATGAYLLASASMLAMRQPMRWIAAIVLTFLVLIALGDATEAAWLAHAVGHLMERLYAGPYGLDTLLTARTESAQIEVPLSTGERLIAWRAAPDLAQWGAATLLWLVAGLTALWAAASRHAEHRRN